MPLSFDWFWREPAFLNMDANVSPSGGSRGGTNDTNRNSGIRGAARGGGGRRGGRGLGRGRGRGAGLAADGVGRSKKLSGQDVTPDSEEMDTEGGEAKLAEGQDSSGVTAGSSRVAAQAEEAGTGDVRAAVAALVEQSLAGLEDLPSDVGLSMINALPPLSTLNPDDPSHVSNLEGRISKMVESMRVKPPLPDPTRRAESNSALFGEAVYNMLSKVYPGEVVPKLTGMLMELFRFELEQMLADPVVMQVRADEALSLLAGTDVAEGGSKKPGGDSDSKGAQQEGLGAAVPEPDLEEPLGDEMDSKHSAPKEGPLVGTFDVLLQVAEQGRASSLWHVVLAEGSLPLLQIPSDVSVAELFASTIRQRDVPSSDQDESQPPCVVQLKVDVIKKGEEKLDKRIILESGTYTLELSEAGRLFKGDLGSLENSADDEPGRKIWENPKLDKVFDCKIKGPTNVKLGVALTVDRGIGSTGKARVLFGRNRTVELTVPSDKLPYAIRAGAPVFLIEHHTVSVNGAVEVCYKFATESQVVDVDRYEDLPMLRAQVDAYGEGVDEMFEVQALVPTTGTMIRYSADIARKNSMPVGTTFYFTPIFDHDDESDTVSPVLPDVQCILEVTETKPQQEVGLSQNQLLTGFYAPDEELQNFLMETFDVSGSPYMGDNISFFDHWGGEEMIRRLITRKGGAQSHYDVSLVDIGEKMALMGLYDKLDDPSEEQIRRALQNPLNLLAIPLKGELDRYAEYVRSQFLDAENAGRPLRLYVGVLVDENVTCGALYNTEICPFFKSSEFPWVKSFNIVHGDYSLTTYDAELHELMPDVRGANGHCVLLVELDSRFSARGSLPTPLAFRAGTVDDAKVADEKRAAAAEVLLGFSKYDKRAAGFIRRCGAAHYKTIQCHGPGADLDDEERGALEETVEYNIVSVSLDSEAKAEALVTKVKDSDLGIFCMTKKNLYASHARTLVCTRMVEPQELITLLHAVEVMPVGKGRFRYTSTRDMMANARVLYRQNLYARSDGKRFRTLRDDNDRFIQLYQKAPVRINRYHRRLQVANGSAGIQRAGAGHIWYQVLNLPRDLPDEGLTSAVEAWLAKEDDSGVDSKQWQAAKASARWLIDRTEYKPSLWLGLKSEIKARPVLKGAFTRVATFLPAVEPPNTATEVGRQVEREDPLAVLMESDENHEYVPKKGTANILKIYERQGPLPASSVVFRRSGDKTRAKPAAATWKTIFRGRGKKQADKGSAQSGRPKGRSNKDGPGGKRSVVQERQGSDGGSSVAQQQRPSGQRQQRPATDEKDRKEAAAKAPRPHANRKRAETASGVDGSERSRQRRFTVQEPSNLQRARDVIQPHRTTVRSYFSNQLAVGQQ